MTVEHRERRVPKDTQFTPDEKAHIDGIMAEFCKALIGQKSSQGGEEEDEGD